MLVLFSYCLLISKNSSQFVTHALFLHTGRDSLEAVLPRALPVNANWFQPNLCRINSPAAQRYGWAQHGAKPEPQGGGEQSGLHGRKLRLPSWVSEYRRSLPV